ncbi:MAG: hypothetical protein JW861_07265 [Bacteroidales bacterium]|nr:hypothetical protein [Bacteroidales bacterium]
MNRIMVFLLTVLMWTAGIQSRLPAQEAGLTDPETWFGYPPGADGKLFTYEELTGYLQHLDAGSGRMLMQPAGTSPLGRTIYICFISSEENISRLDELKEINRRLALDPEIPDPERSQLIENGRVFFLATLSMHSTEVGPSQSAPLIAWDLATTKDPQKLEWLGNVVYMMVPCHNPDGMDMIVEHYRKYDGSRLEGSSMPGLYHKYVGHDNNRDFIILSQEDNRAIARIYNLDWFPQVMVEKHQMGSRGVRYFVPPPHDPIAENVDAGIWNWIGIFGSNLMTDMTADSLSGVAQHYLFDDYWPGSTETCIWKNVIGFLTECASVQIARPVYIEPNELGAHGKGLAEYKKSINMPDPWPGGWWRLGDIISYEISSTLSIIKTSSANRKEILAFRNDLCRKEVQKGMSKPPFYYVLPEDQHDPGEWAGIVNLLMEHGVRCYRLEREIRNGGQLFMPGDIVIPLAQPFRAFIKEVLETQVFPLRHYTPGGEIIRPYDITSWSLPLHRGVDVKEINTRLPDLESSCTEITGSFRLSPGNEGEFAVAIFSSRINESYKAAFMASGMGLKVERIPWEITTGEKSIPAGSFLVYPGEGWDELAGRLTVAPHYLSEVPEVDKVSFNVPRIALVESWFHDMDAGWARYVLDQYHIPFTMLRPADLEKETLAGRFDVIIFPDEDKSVLTEGRYKSDGEYYISSYPPEYAKGMGKKGMEQLMDFLDREGIIVSWGQSVELFDQNLAITRGTPEKGKEAETEKEEFRLPFRVISERLSKQGLYCPGSLVRVRLRTDHPLTYGMPEETGVFFRGREVFSTSVPDFDMDRRVIARFPEKDILMSGYCEKEELLSDKTVMVWLRKGQGQLVLFGFSPQFRASTQATYKLLFNALLLGPVEIR